jgi:hypothetical protein
MFAIGFALVLLGGCCALTRERGAPLRRVDYVGGLSLIAGGMLMLAAMLVYFWRVLP